MKLDNPKLMREMQRADIATIEQAKRDYVHVILADRLLQNAQFRADVGLKPVCKDCGEPEETDDQT